MTKEQLQILQHSLGVDKYGLGRQYRNHFCPGGRDIDICKSLVILGYMEVYIAYDDSEVYRVTDEGKKAVREESPKPDKKTRSQMRYREYLRVSDALNCTFGEFLKLQKTEWYKEMKANG
jgi:hypothetical protein